MRSYRLRAITITVVLCLVLTLPSLVQADIVWSEDFSSNPEERWTEIGEANYDDSRCRGTEGSASDIIYRPSEVSVGTWSFDVKYVGEFIRVRANWPQPISLIVRFMCTNPEVSCNRCCFEMERVDTSTGSLWECKFYYEIGDDQTELAGYDTPELTDMHRVQHITITRDTAGHLTALINGTVIMQATDTTINISDYFALVFSGDFAVDNIVVDDTPLQTFPMDLLAIGIGGAGLVIIVAVVILKRR